LLKDALAARVSCLDHARLRVRALMDIPRTVRRRPDASVKTPLTGFALIGADGLLITFRFYRSRGHRSILGEGFAQGTIVVAGLVFGHSKDNSVEQHL